jgi:hypothetical protein
MRLALAFSFSLPLLACGGMPAMNGPDMGMMQNACTHPVTCTDQSVQQLALFRAVNAATIDNQAAGGVFTSSIDATGGGLTPTKAYVYARFTDQGLTRIDVGDEDAFTSSDWDIAFRRFVVRLNSGISGPSCVTAARTASGTTFDALTAVPGNLSFRTEEYFTATCDLVPDGSGLGSPGVALQSYWEYPGCVKMTNNVFVVKLADGRHVKLQVLAYYGDAAQAACDANGMLPMGMPSGAGNMKIKWAFLP